MKPRKKQMKTPHKHAELIKAWADGADIEHQHYVGDSWADSHNPGWFDNVLYRLRTTPKPDVLKYVVVHPGGAGILSKCQCKYDNLKLTFDGETGDLKLAEVL